MIDHIGITVPDMERSRAFYTQALAPLGYTLLVDVPAAVAGRDHAGFGIAPKPDFWCGAAAADHPATTPIHHSQRFRSRESRV